jgi:hypothetical protein
MALTLMQLKIILRNIVTNNCDLSNYDEKTIAILIGNGYVVATGDERYRVTQKAMKRAERTIWQSSDRPNDRSL